MLFNRFIAGSDVRLSQSRNANFPILSTLYNSKSNVNFEQPSNTKSLIILIPLIDSRVSKLPQLWNVPFSSSAIPSLKNLDNCRQPWNASSPILPTVPLIFTDLKPKQNTNAWPEIFCTLPLICTVSRLMLPANAWKPIISRSPSIITCSSWFSYRKALAATPLIRFPLSSLGIATVFFWCAPKLKPVIISPESSVEYTLSIILCPHSQRSSISEPLIIRPVLCT